MHSLPRLRTRLDRAIFGSVLAMLAMNVVVLAHQLQPGPAVAMAASAAGQA